mmetsp:Transcript_10393/g.22783  ORF Transcript_10393/g.22783 Transcript_10393/m.22783 type:complete len:275 (-) Transcript_10393:577-1401(-)
MARQVWTRLNPSLLGDDVRQGAGHLNLWAKALQFLDEIHAQVLLVELSLQLEIQEDLPTIVGWHLGVQLSEVRVRQKLRYRAAVPRIDDKHFLQNVNTVRAGTGEALVEVLGCTLGEALHVHLSLLLLQRFNEAGIWVPEHPDDRSKLVSVALGMKLIVTLVIPCRGKREARRSREKRPAIAGIGNIALHHAQQLSKDASYPPDINLLIILLLQQNQLRRTVPARHDVLSQCTRHVVRRLHLLQGVTRGGHHAFKHRCLLHCHCAAQAKVADLQ